MSANANRWAIALGAALLASTTAAWASDTVEHSGTVKAVDGGRNTITIEEMGPWRPGHVNVRREVFVMTPEVKVELARRADVAGSFPGQWGLKSLRASDLRAGDYATLAVTTGREGGRPRVTEVVVVRPDRSEQRAGVHPTRGGAHS
jgi:hypothetical protein